MRNVYLLLSAISLVQILLLTIALALLWMARKELEKARKERQKLVIVFRAEDSAETTAPIASNPN